MLHTICASLLLLGATSCGAHYVDCPYHRDGLLKPKVVLIPLCDASESFLPWDLASELNYSLRYYASCNDKLCFLTPNEFSSAVEEVEDLFAADCQLAKRFCHSDFVVALKIIQHELVPFEKGKTSPAFPANSRNCQSVLQMKVQLQVIDVRRQEPKITLQEILSSSYAIPCEEKAVDYCRIQWKCKAFSLTPCGLAHQQLIRDVLYRLETVMLGE